MLVEDHLKVEREIDKEIGMTKEQIYETAMRQSAIDCGCDWKDFTLDQNKVVISKENEGARKYLRLPFECDLVSYGSNIVASVSEDLAKVTGDYISRFSIEHCFETPNLYVLNSELEQRGLRVCFMAEYFLPEPELLTGLSCDYEMKLLTPGDFEALYVPEWSNALCEERKELDVLGVGAYDRGRLIGLAGCSADCESMWQIGIDVLPEYRLRGIAAALTSRLAIEVLKRGKVPFYCAAWSNIKSVKNAIKCGFRPAWAEITAKDEELISKMNAGNVKKEP